MSTMRRLHDYQAGANRNLLSESLSTEIHDSLNGYLDSNIFECMDCSMHS